jgi:hypothetical protein
MVIVRPGGLPIDAGVIAALLSASVYAVYITLTRKVSRTDSTATSMVYVGVIGLVLSTAVGVFYWQPLDWRAAVMVGVVMVTMVAGHGLMMKALALAPASVLQPFNYLSLPWGIVLSFAVFGHLIDPISLVGAAVIALAGLVVMARERRKGTMRVEPAEALGPPPPSPFEHSSSWPSCLRSLHRSDLSSCGRPVAKSLPARGREAMGSPRSGWIRMVKQALPSPLRGGIEGGGSKGRRA